MFRPKPTLKDKLLLGTLEQDIAHRHRFSPEFSTPKPPGVGTVIYIVFFFVAAGFFLWHLFKWLLGY